MSTIRRMLGAYVARRQMTAAEAVGVAEDLLQEFLLCLLKMGPERLRKLFGGGRDPLPYVKTIAINVVRKHFRRCSLVHQAVSEHVFNLITCQSSFLGRFLSATEREFTVQRLRTQLACMLRGSRRSRDLRFFDLYYLEGWTAKEIALAVGEGLDAKGVESVLHRIVHKLRRSLTSRGPRGGLRRDSAGAMATSSDSGGTGAASCRG